jgi:hypothetical protein
MKFEELKRGIKETEEIIVSSYREVKNLEPSIREVMRNVYDVLFQMTENMRTIVYFLEQEIDYLKKKEE